MPKLIEYISAGFCAGYGDGDYRVSLAVCNLSRKEFDELRLSVLNALRCAEDHWRDAQPKDHGVLKSAIATTPNPPHPREG
jgi:hypothetical protein